MNLRFWARCSGRSAGPSTGFDPPVGCRDGREAIEKLEGGFVPDVLITDICMPFVDGLELTRYINEHLPNTVVVILTGYDDFQYAHRAIKMQVYDYVLKPVTPASINELTDRLRGSSTSAGCATSTTRCRSSPATS